MKKYFSFLLSFILLTSPVLTFAQQTVGGSSGTCDYQIESIAEIFHLFGCILAAAVIPMLVTLAVVIFIIGVIKYISKADEEAGRKEGKNLMIYGIIGLFVIVSIWGLVGIIQGTFGLGTNVLIPQLQGV